VNSPYAGNYEGEFEDAQGVTGIFILNVAPNGTLQGQYDYNPALTFTGSIGELTTGTITTSAGTSAISLGPTGSSISATVANTSGNGANVVLVLNPNDVFGGANPFTGDFAGTVTNSTLNKTGVLALTVSSSGVVTGSDLVDAAGTPTLTTITGTLSSAGALQYTVAATQVVVTGTVTITNGAISGSLSESNGDSATLALSPLQYGNSFFAGPRKR
jgi:hypothetical protein